MNKRTILPAIIVLLFFPFCHSADTVKTPATGADTAAIRQSIPSSPVRNVSESIAIMKLENGFSIKSVAAEPLVEAPVAMTFDEQGRMWVVEMTGYMPVLDGKGEEQPSGRIVILEDTNHDGAMDVRHVFLDKLVLPRAICLTYGGILVAEPPKLWFVKINGLTAGEKSVVDDRYAFGGNPEHQPNGLMRGMDNWIYSGDCAKRYRLYGRKWITEPALARGQWGISQDDFGRLFYNNNSENLLGDYFPPSLLQDGDDVPGFNERIVDDNRVYPARPTTGVNRGYLKGILDDSLRLRNFTAACGPVIYRGVLFGPEYQGNAFVAEPSANLIKRNIIADTGTVVHGRQAYTGKEFLTSTDERFRPVSLYNGPDGALYVVDMYRGIIQHETFLTDYLKQEIIQRKLVQPLNCGRIYRIAPENRVASPVVFPKDTKQLVSLLSHPNGWVRDRAQQLLVDKKDLSIVDALRRNLTVPGNIFKIIHSFWTLEGLGSLREADVDLLLSSTMPAVRMQAVAAAQPMMNKKNLPRLTAKLESIISQRDTTSAAAAAFLLRKMRALDSATAAKFQATIESQFAHQHFVAGAIQASRPVQRAPGVSKKLQDKYPEGFTIFNTVCKTCHGEDGNGIASLAPPLNGSEWVKGDKNKLASIVLYGLIGPVKVAGHLYAAPEVGGEMPGIGNNKAFTNEQIAQLLSLIRAAWRNTSEPVTADDIQSVRHNNASRQQPFHMDELSH